MKLKAVMFYLCAGMLSSVVSNSAFAMSGKKSPTHFGKLDPFHAMVVSQYFKTLDDFVNLECTNKKFRGTTIDRFRYNPIPVKPKDIHKWKIDTLYIYNTGTLNQWRMYNGTKRFHKIECFSWVDYKIAKQEFNEDGLYRLIRGNGDAVGITFRNVFTEWNLPIREPFNQEEERDDDFKIEGDCIGRIEPTTGEAIFNKYVYTDGDVAKSRFVIRGISSANLVGNLDISSITFPGSIEFIDYEEIADCSNLKYVDLSKTRIDGISRALFEQCSSLETILLPKTIRWIDQYAFWGCSSLKTLEVPNGVFEFDFHAIDNCTNLTELKVHNSLANVEPIALSKCPNCTVFVPNKMMKNQILSEATWRYITELKPYDCFDSFWDELHNTIVAEYANNDLCNLHEAIEDIRFNIQEEFEDIEDMLPEPGCPAEVIVDESLNVDEFNFLWPEDGVVRIPDYLAKDVCKDGIMNLYFLRRNDITRIIIPDDILAIDIFSFDTCALGTIIEVNSSIAICDLYFRYEIVQAPLNIILRCKRDMTEDERNDIRNNILTKFPTFNVDFMDVD